MEIQTNHNLRLLNAKCEYVCIVDNLSKKLDYGDDVECCLNKLFLASKLINRLECYNFPLITVSENVNSEFFTTLVEVQGDRLYRIVLLNIELTVNGITYNIVSDGVNTALVLIVNKLTELGFFVSYINSKGDTELTFGLTCDILNISFNIRYSDTPWVAYSFSNTVLGACPIYTTTTFDNCIEQSDLREMYAVLDNLLS